MKKYFSKKLLIISFVFVLILFFPILADAAFTSGTLSASSTTVNFGQPVTITVSGQDNDGLCILEVYYHGDWHSQSVIGSLQTSRSWQLVEDYPGIYQYCGRVAGYKTSYTNSQDTVATSPSCIQVTVLDSTSFCSNECQTVGESRCYNSTNRQVCGNYDSDFCLEWSSVQSCVGNTSCGYGNCSSNQRPSWYCSGGSCSYNCVYDSQCAPLCECSSGPCCDGCHYKNSAQTCNFETQTDYGCPWGLQCGVDVGKRTRTRLQYCSGSSFQCNGRFGDWLTWTNWIVSDSCSASEICPVGSSQCQADSACSQPSSYAKYYSKHCFDSDLYWFDSNGLRQDKYKDCSDDNECTIDSCETGKCVNELKCEGTTCKIDSGNYCKSCEHCGDGVCNCQETAGSCSQDCKAGCFTVSILGKRQNEPLQWLKNLDIKPGEKVDFLLVVANGGEGSLNDVVVKTELPEEIVYEGDLKVDGGANSGDIKAGVNIGSLPEGGVRIISFVGEAKSVNIKAGEKEIVGIANAGNLSDSDSVKITFQKSTAVAGVGLAAIKFFVQKWYFWVLAVLLAIFLFFTIFRRLFSAVTG